jgi:hypothetical protein
LLEQVFVDYPDAKFLDAMLLKWTLVAFQSGDFAKARDKCAQLISEYPDSPHAQKAKQMTRLEILRRAYEGKLTWEQAASAPQSPAVGPASACSHERKKNLRTFGVADHWLCEDCGLEYRR